ncbi:hypothetical protein RFI_05604 [Reticulomyxa filosa]|uniref:Uncharacterized protein n=1 Tax=Reticulomyxa filosa TaxID=46433 RepID=X6NZV4_RETFI|nr:hypothetical protein RFI_05604 [Reticulomyxa filosa]|eukprot:ETO31516.1 hypothetical protein RFI_05604 [Reticulomyxa filosa]
MQIQKYKETSMHIMQRKSRSSSLIYTKIQETIQRLCITFTKRETDIIERKRVKVNQDHKENPTYIKIMTNANKQSKCKLQTLAKQKNETEIFKKDNKQQHQHIGHEYDDVYAILAEVASLRATIDKLSSFINKIMQSIERNWNNGVNNNFSQDLSFNANETTDKYMNQW